MHILTIKVLLIALFAGIALGAAMSTPEGLEYLAANAAKPGVVTLPSGLQYRVLTRSTNSLGVTPNSSSLCHVHYRGTTIKGFEFDSSYKRGKPTKFRPSDVVRGWTEALLMMKEGDKWQLVIPAELAYGKRSMGELITPGSVLVFEIELIQVEEENGSNGIVGSVLKFIPRFLRELPAGVWAVVIAFLYMIIVPESGSSNKTRVPVAQVQGNPCNDRVFVEVKIGDGSPDRVEFELFTAHVPKTATNFLHLCLGDKGTAAKPLSFKNSPFHRVIPNFMAQGGDITHGNGRGGESIYGEKFEDEWTNGVVPHDEPYLLSMANAGKNTNGSQFFVTFVPCSWLDEKHVVFGKLISGKEVMDKVKAVGSSSGSTRVPVMITSCGVVKRGEPLSAAKTDGDKKKD